MKSKSNNGIRKNSSLNLMAGRLGIFGDSYLPPKKEGDGIADEHNVHELPGLKNQTQILQHFGGTTQQARMINDKLRSLNKALLYSYQAATVKKVVENSDKIDEQVDGHMAKALINPNKLKPDYDDKIISINYKEGFDPGDVFEWVGTNTYWLIYLQDLTELAYFRGDIRKCSFGIKWKSKDGELKHTYAAIRGPVETKINFIQKGGTSVDVPNHTLNIIMPKNKDTVEYFVRYSKFYLTEMDESVPDICWRVTGVDSISSPGILELTATEYYANQDEDNVATGIAGGLIEPIQTMNAEDVEILISGETFIKPRKTYTYKYKGINNSNWSIDPKYPVKYEIDKEDPTLIKIRWESSYSGQFDLTFGNFTKTIVVESMF